MATPTAPVPEILPGGNPAPVSPTPEDPDTASKVEFRTYQFDGIEIDAPSGVLVLPVSPDFTMTGFEYVVTSDLSAGGVAATVAAGFSADGATVGTQVAQASLDGSDRGEVTAAVTPTSAGANTHVYVEVEDASDQTATISVSITGHIVPAP